MVEGASFKATPPPHHHHYHQPHWEKKETHRRRCLFWSPSLEGSGDLETAQPPCSIIGFIELASGQCFFFLFSKKTLGTFDWQWLQPIRAALCEPYRAGLRLGGGEGEGRCFQNNAVFHCWGVYGRVRGFFLPPIILQFTFGPACNGLLQFSQQPGRILRSACILS